MNPLAKKRVPDSRAHCHILVAKTAQGIAHECYAILMSRNDWYAEWKELNPSLTGEALESRWVATRWGWFLETARATLGETLRQTPDPALQKQIYEALILDAQLTRGRKNRGANTNA